MTLFAAFLFGLCLGSFLNVCIHRLPRQLSIVSPRSRCPHCGRPIAFYDNLPVLSYLLLGGRCRHCKRPISTRYPVVELTTAFLATLMAWRWAGTGLWVAAGAIAAGVLFAIAVIDWETFLIPNPLSLGLLALGLAISPVNPLLSGTLAGRLLSCLIGAAAGFLMTWLTAVIGERIFRREALGGGDIKLLTAIGALTGWIGAFSTLMIASFFGALFGLSLMALKRLGRREPIPFGPFLSLGALVTLLDFLPKGFPFFITLP